MKKFENKIKKACVNYIIGYNRTSAMYIDSMSNVVRGIKF